MLTLDQHVGHSLTQTRSERAEFMARGLRRLGVPVVIGRLNSGDAAFPGGGPGGGEVRVGVELKTASGLLGDLVTGRFVGRQVPEMQKDFEYRYLVLEGPFRPSPVDGMLEIPRGEGQWWTPPPRIMYIDFLKWLDDVELRAGFHLRRTWNPSETLHVLAAEYLSWRKPWDKHRGLNRIADGPTGGVIQLHPPTLVRLWARDLPGVGWERSAAVERMFRRPLDLAIAGEDQWRMVPGVGKILALRIWKAIRGLK